MSKKHQRNRRLIMGVDAAPASRQEADRRVRELIATVERYLPDFAKAVTTAEDEGLDVIMLHQDAFAAGYNSDEYVLLGMAMKFAGLHGIPVTIAGTNGETCRKPTKRDGRGESK